MTREEALDILHHNWTRIDNPNYKEEELDEAFFMAIEALKEQPTIPMFTESEEAYKAWTGEGISGDEINEMNREIIKDILKTIPTAYLLEALGVATFEELMESADRPHGEWLKDDYLYKCSVCGNEEIIANNYCPSCGAWMGGDGE